MGMWAVTTPPSVEMTVFLICFATSFYLMQVTLAIYFAKMAFNYISILKEDDKLNKCTGYLIVSLMTFLFAIGKLHNTVIITTGAYLV